MKRDYIKQVFTDLKVLKYSGIYFSGVRREGEYKKWYHSGGLCVHCFWKNNKLEGEYKRWDDHGKLKAYRLYKNGKLVKDYLKESKII